MTPPVTVSLFDGTKVVVPDSINLITPYVLIEQQDWFEPELDFLRRVVQPGQVVIDVGANYGVYTLSLAKAVGATGKVWAFEPASATASLLTAAIAANGFTNVVLEQSALSSKSGVAQLSLSPNSELNALSSDGSSTTDSETVPLVTLDHCMVRNQWRDVAFIKIDAEGEEMNILHGGRRFFSELSPLVQFEIKAGADVDFRPAKHLAGLGYSCFYLIAELDLLVPFDESVPFDGFLLNLFACKQDQIDRLANRGFLIGQAEIDEASVKHAGDPASKKATLIDTYHWRNVLSKMPYGKMHEERWEAMDRVNAGDDVATALALFALSQDVSRSPCDRFCALRESFKRLDTLCVRAPSGLRLSSFARVANAIGARNEAIRALAKLGQTVITPKLIDSSEVFLTPCSRFDGLVPGESIDQWLEAAVLETLEMLRAYSSYYTGKNSLGNLKRIHALGFGSPAMDRRVRLIQMRFGDPKVADVPGRVA